MVQALGRDFQITDLGSYQDMSIYIPKRMFRFYRDVPVVALQLHFINCGYGIGMMIGDGHAKRCKPVVPDRTLLFFLSFTSVIHAIINNSSWMTIVRYLFDDV
jgi:hypothetical protein